MAQHYIVTADLRELIGDIDFSRIQAAVTTSLPPGSVIVDKTNKQLNLGVGPVPISLDGTVTMSLLETDATDTNAAGWKYWLEITAPEHAVARKALRQERPVYRIGPFAVTAHANLADLSDQFETPATSPEWRDALVAASKDTLAEMYSLLGALGGVRNHAALDAYRAVDPAVTTRRIVLIGDSITDGGLASTYGNTYAMKLQTKLRAAGLHTGGIGYVPATPSTGGAIVPAIPNTRNGTDRMWEHGLGGRAMMLGNAAHHVTYDAQPCTRVKVYYGKTTVAGGGLKVEIDGVDQGVTLSSVGTGSNSGGYTWTSPALTPGNHTVKITPSVPPFVGIVEGVEFINGDESSGIRVYNGGHSGGTVAQFNIANMLLHWQSVAAIDPHLAIINLGTNDLASANVADFLSGFDTMLTKITAPSVLVVGNYLRGDYQTDAGRAKWEQMQAGLRERATGRVAYLDLAPHWPRLEASGATSAGLMGDVPPIHPNDAGMEKIATVLTAALSPIVSSTLVGPQGPPGANAIPTKAAVDTYGAELVAESSSLRSALASQITTGTSALGASTKSAVNVYGTELLADDDSYLTNAVSTVIGNQVGDPGTQVGGSLRTHFVPEGSAYADIAKHPGVDPTGVTECAGAINNAIVAIAASGMRPYAKGTFKIASTVTITTNCDFSDATFNYTGTTGTAVRLGHGVSGQWVARLNVLLPRLVATAKTTTGWAQVAGTIGVDICNVYSSKIHIPRVTAFETGVRVYGMGQGTCHNVVTLGWLENNKVNQLLTADSSGWANQNLFLGGRFHHNSNEGTATAGAYHIKMDVTTHAINTNHWANPSVEGNTPQYHVVFAGCYNIIDNGRWEASSGPRVHWDSGALLNTVRDGYGAEFLTESFAAGAYATNRILSSVRSIVAGTGGTTGIQVLENTSSSAYPTDVIMQAGSRLAGTSPVTGYSVARGPQSTRMKNGGDTYDRLVLRHTDGKVLFGDGSTAAPTVNLGIVGTTGLGLGGGNLYFTSDNTQDIGLASSLRPRYVRAASAVVTGSGASGTRPAAATAGRGAMYFDSTLGKPIWSNGTNWVDATGATV